MKRSEREEETEAIIRARILQLRQLSYLQAAALPEGVSEDLVVAGRKAAVATYAEAFEDDEILVTVLVAYSHFFGMCSSHTERGLVFGQDGSVRDATSTELIMHGG